MNTAPRFSVGDRVIISDPYLEVNHSTTIETWCGQPCVVLGLRGTWADLRLAAGTATISVPRRTLRHV